MSACEDCKTWLGRDLALWKGAASGDRVVVVPGSVKASRIKGTTTATHGSVPSFVCYSAVQ